VDEFGFKDLKYKYMEWDPGWLDDWDKDGKEEDKGKLCLMQNLTDVADKGNPPTTLNVIKLLRWSVNKKKTLPNVNIKFGKEIYHRKEIYVWPDIDPEHLDILFRMHMKTWLDAGLLPYLLICLDQRYSSVPKLDSDIRKPALSSLLDLPLVEAKKNLERIYLDYQLKRSDGDATEAARASGLSSKDAFKQRHARAKKCRV
jgi:hypothetical protein